MTLSSTIMPVYRRADILMERGEGVYLFDDTGKRYLDFAAGIAVNALGHSHPRLVEALQSQAGKLWHCSNLFSNAGVVEFSEKLASLSFADAIFCCSSGAEAVESAIKFIRRYHHVRETGRNKIIVAEGGFHGRTLGALSAGSNSRVQESYHPLLEGFETVAFDDIAALEVAMDKNAAAIMLEPVQGEGGVRPHSKAYLQRARELADEHGAVLFFDEVQCGTGRLGTLFAYEYYDVVPDVVTIGKGIGSGFPVAAVLATQAISDTMTPGCHGSTYGSNPLAMAVGTVVLEEITHNNVLGHSQRMGRQLKAKLQGLVKQFPDQLEEVRGLGLMLGLVTKTSAYELNEKLRDAGLLLAPAGDSVLRVVPPLIIDESHIDEAIQLIAENLKD
ncbi:MAG: aspartate aminotransferase family protein [Rickettsiales bacterium]|nr:aspartate aminotransferase family protein [Rickettsiales bacterium]